MDDDEKIASFTALHPFDFCHLSRMTLSRPASPAFETVLQLMLSPRSGPDTSMLVLTCVGIESFEYDLQDFGTYYIAINAIHDRGWERLRYVVEAEHGEIRFYCRDFDARLIDMANERLPEIEDVLK